MYIYIYILLVAMFIVSIPTIARWPAWLHCLHDLTHELGGASSIVIYLVYLTQPPYLGYFRNVKSNGGEGYNKRPSNILLTHSHTFHSAISLWPAYFNTNSTLYYHITKRLCLRSQNSTRDP